MNPKFCVSGPFYLFLDVVDQKLLKPSEFIYFTEIKNEWESHLKKKIRRLKYVRSPTLLGRYLKDISAVDSSELFFKKNSKKEVS